MTNHNHQMPQWTSNNTRLNQKIQQPKFNHSNTTPTTTITALSTSTMAKSDCDHPALTEAMTTTAQTSPPSKHTQHTSTATTARWRWRMSASPTMPTRQTIAIPTVTSKSPTSVPWRDKSWNNLTGSFPGERSSPCPRWSATSLWRPQSMSTMGGLNGQAYDRSLRRRRNRSTMTPSWGDASSRAERPYRDKSRGVGEIRAKARVVLIGCCDPDLERLTRDSPTPTRLSECILMSVAASGANGDFNNDGRIWRLWVSDAEKAFLQGDQDTTERSGQPLHAPTKRSHHHRGQRLHGTSVFDNFKCIRFAQCS